MSGASATHLILFIGSLVIATAVAGTIVLEVDQLSGAIENRGGAVSEEIETEIEIISDAGSDAMVDEDGNVTILVKNIGPDDLEVHENQVDVLVDGAFISNDALDLERVDGDGETWRPGGVVAVTVADADVDGDTRVSIVVNGNEANIEFHA